MNRSNPTTGRFFSLPRWSLLGLSALAPFIFLALLLLSASIATAEPSSPTSDVFGVVLAPDGAPLADTTWVSLAHLDPGGWEDWSTGVETAPDGSFNFTETIPGEYIPGDFVLQAYAPWDSPFHSSLPVELYIENEADPIDMGDVYLTFPSFWGTVYEPDGVTPAQWGDVVLEEFGWGEVAGGYYTDTGWYEIGGVPDGEFMLIAQAPLDSLLWRSEPVPVSVTMDSQYDPDATQYIDLFLEPPNVVGQVVYPDFTPAEWITNTEAILGYAEVKAEENDGWAYEERMTASSGEFGMRLPPSDYWMWAVPEEEMAPGLTRSIPRLIPAPEGTPAFDVGELRLTFPSFMGMILDPMGNPAPDCVDVWLETPDGEWMVSDWVCPPPPYSRGLNQPPPPPLYQLGGIPAGEYWLMTGGIPEHGLLPAEPILVYVEPGSQYDPDATLFIDLVLQPAAGPLVVEVVNPAGALVPAHVTLKDEWGLEEWRMSHPGDPARFWGLEPGEYMVQAWPTGMDIPALANSEPVWLFVEEPMTITLELLIPNVVGTIVTPEGDPLPPAYNEWDDPVHPAEVNFHNEDWSIDVWAIMTNMAGEFSLALPHDHYVLRGHPFASLNLTYTKSLPVEFWTPGPGDPPLNLGPIPLTYPCIGGWVATPDDERVSAGVDLWSEDGSYWDWDDTLWYPPDVEKPFRFGGLRPGHYFVQSGSPYDDPGAFGSSNVYDFFVPDDCGQEITLTLEAADFIGYLLLPPDSDCPECPVPWAEVKLRNATETFEAWTSTDESGRFAFSGLEPGVYVVKAFVPEELAFEWDAPLPEHFTMPTLDPPIERVMYLQHAVRNKHVVGVVVYDDNGDPVGDDDGDGEGDAFVYAYHDETGHWTGKPSMPDGSYGLDLKGGLWWIGVEPIHPGVDWYFDPDWEQPVEFPYDPTLELTEWLTLTVARAEFFHVTGVVTTPNGAPIVPGTVKADLCDDEGHCFGGPVGPDGFFEIRALPGIYRFWIHVDPDTHLLPPLDNGFDVYVFENLDLGMFWLRAIGDRTASVSGRVIISPTGAGLSGVEIEAWTDTGDWNRTKTGAGGNYVLKLFPGHWFGGPWLSEEQQEQYVVLPPRRREGRLKAGETISNVNFYVVRRDATIQGHVVDISTTLVISDIGAFVFAEYCPPDVTRPCRLIAETEVREGAFELGVIGNHTYTLGIWIPGGGYMAGPPVDVFVGRDQTAYKDVAVIQAGTRIHGYLVDTDLDPVYIPASVYGTERTQGYWVEDFLWPEKDPYEFELWVPTPASEPMTWTLRLGVPPHTGYTSDPAHPKYTVVVPPGETNIGQIMYVRELDTQIMGKVLLFDGTAIVPAPYVWVFAEGKEGTDSKGLYFEAETDENGDFAMFVLPGEYVVNAYLPPHLADDFIPPLPKNWNSMADNPVVLRFRPRPTGVGALRISGNLTVSPTGALGADAPILVLGWSPEAGYSEVTGTLANGYRLPVISNTTWYVWAVREDPDNDALYFSAERKVKVGAADVSGINLMLELADFALPDAICESFDPLAFKRISLPTRPGVPEPLIDIQAGTMPVSGTVQVCATPILGVPRGQDLVGFAYEIEARDSSGELISEDFNKPVRMTFYFNADMLGDADPEELEPGFYSTARQEWVSLDDVFIDPSDWFATGKTEHFTKMGILSAAPEAAADNYIYLPVILKAFGG